MSIQWALYDQIRLIDETGMEIARVNYNNGNPYVADKNDLQNKSGRYYFDDAIKLQNGEIFVSPLDLNIEHGEIEQPLKPMIRFATPVYDQFGNKRGIILLNYFGDKLLQRFSIDVNTSTGSQLMLLNSDGYWLFNPNPEYAWGFMYENKMDLTFGSIYPEAREKLLDSDKVQLKGSQGLFTIETVYPILFVQKSTPTNRDNPINGATSQNPSEYYWKIVSFVPNDVLNAGQKTQHFYASIILFAIGIFLFASSWQINKARFLRGIAEEELKNSALRYQGIFNGVSDAILVETLAGKVLDVNESACEMYGWKRDEFLTKGINDMVPEGIDALLSENDSDSIETINRRANGDHFPVSVSGKIETINNQPQLLVVVRDITQQKDAEFALREAKDWAEQLFKTVPSAIFTVDKEMLITSINKTALDILGYPEYEIVGKPCLTFSLNPCQDRCGLFVNDVPKPIKKKECTIQTKDGQVRTIIKNADLMYDFTAKRVIYPPQKAETLI